MPKRFQIGVKGLIIVDGKVLLLKRTADEGGSFWELPGGRMEAGEEIEATLRRELGEEVPSLARVEVGRLLHAALVRDDESGLVLLFYRVQADATLPLVLSTEHIGHTWASAEDLPALTRDEGGIAIFAYTLAAVTLALGAATAPGSAYE